MSLGVQWRALMQAGQRNDAPSCGRFVFFLLLTLSVGVAFWARGVEAEAVVRAVLIDPHDAQLVARISGQTHDLALTLTVLDVAVSDEAAARALALQQHARAVLWLTSESTGYAVHLYDATQRGIGVREVQAGRANEALASSATLEAVALVVRAELSGVLSASQPTAAGSGSGGAAAGGTSGGTQTGAGTGGSANGASATSRGRAEDEGSKNPGAAGAPNKSQPTAAGAEAADTHASETAGARSSDPRHDRALHWLLGAETGASVAGSDLLSAAISGRAGLAIGSLRAGVSGSFGFPNQLQDDITALRLQRHALGAFASLQPFGPLHTSVGWLELHLGVELSLLFFSRRAGARASNTSGLVPTGASQLVSAAAAAEARFDLLFTPSFGLEAALGVQAVPWAPRYVYERSGQREERTHYAFVEPRLGLGVVVLF